MTGSTDKAPTIKVDYSRENENVKGAKVNPVQMPASKTTLPPEDPVKEEKLRNKTEHIGQVHEHVVEDVTKKNNNE